MAKDQRGRPRSSSVAVLEDAATELFLEQGYHQTTIDQITKRAGVSRATFFNYFASKSDVLWLHVDQALQTLDHALERGATLSAALSEVASTMATGFPPLIASHADALDAGDDLAADAGARVVELARIVEKSGVPSDRVWIVTGAIVQSALQWAGAGASRAHPGEYLRAQEKVAPEVGLSPDGRID
jgi:AcrR family transcriptional regulator